MRLIDIDALPKGRVEWEDIENAPTINAVEVVRCKDCIAFDSSYKVCKRYGGMASSIDEDDFCSHGERKEE